MERFEVKGPKGTAEFLFYPDQLIIDRGTATPLLSITRPGFVEHCNVVLGLFVTMVVLRRPERVGFRLEADALRGLRRWLEPTILLLLGSHLKTRLRWALPLGILNAVFALPIQSARFDPFGFAFGTALVIVSLAGLVRKHRVLLLGDAVTWMLMALTNLRPLIERASIFGGLLMFLGVSLAIGSLRSYRWFGPPVPDPTVVLGAD